MIKTSKPGESAKRRPKKSVLKSKITYRYGKHMPDRKRHRLLVWVIFFTCTAVVAAQLLYSPDHALPRARIAGEMVGRQSHEQLAETIERHFRASKLRLMIDEYTSSELLLASVGAELNTERMIDGARAYPFWQRFIPFSILLRANNVSEADVYYADNILRSISDEQAKAFSVSPQNARLAIEDGNLVATSEKPGRSVTADAVHAAIAQSVPALGRTTEITVPSEALQPAKTSSSLQAVQVLAEAALSRQVVIAAGDHTFTADSATIASWLQLSTDESDKPTLAIADDKLNKYFDQIDSEAGVPAGRTNINLVDGHETGRTVGQLGRAVRRTELAASISRWLLQGEGQAEVLAQFDDVAPSLIYDNKYTPSEEGLRAYVSDASRRMNVRIAIQQVDGGRWSASSRASESIPSASTYKLFVAKWLFDEIDKGAIRWDDAMLDTTVSGCFDRMVIASTNPCAELWLARFGRANMNNYIYKLGFGHGTSFTNSIATHSTANDLQRMMLGINDGSLISGANRDRLLQALNTHPYRYGIAAGSAGQVYDKVGFLWDYVHDTAIVHHPRGAYVMTIMTKGQSYATIASLTREIEKIMYT